MKPIKQYIKTNKFKKSEKLKKKFFYLLDNLFYYLDFTKNLAKNQSEILLKENVCDVDVIEFEKSFNISRKMLYISNITSLMMTLTKVIRIEGPNY